jgi:hypothetical protein
LTSARSWDGRVPLVDERLIRLLVPTL